jgi:hypothetical protein
MHGHGNAPRQEGKMEGIRVSSGASLHGRVAVLLAWATIAGGAIIAASAMRPASLVASAEPIIASEPSRCTMPLADLSLPAS